MTWNSLGHSFSVIFWCNEFCTVECFQKWSAELHSIISISGASLVEFKHVTDGKNARELRKQYQPWLNFLQNSCHILCFRINNVLALKHEKEDFDGDTNVKIRNRTVVQPSSNKTATTGELIRTGRWKWKFYWVWMVVHIYPRTLTRPVGIQTR